MGPRTQALGIPRHVFGWVQSLSFRSQARTIRMGQMSPRSYTPSSSLSRWSRKCSSFDIEIWREHHHPKGLAKSHLEGDFWAFPARKHKAIHH